MNKKRREQIQKVIDKLSECSEELNSIRDDEDCYRDEMPENLQNSERYEQSEEYSDILDDAATSIDDVVTNLQEITQ
jgi:uncharacterized coiled-coil DUF342 family protein